MPQYEFPHANVSGAQKEKFIRDIDFLNYHINHDKWAWYKNFHIAFAHRVEEDFCCYDSDCWTTNTTEQGSGSATEACTDMVNGVLLVTNAGGRDDLDELTYGCECFKLVDGYPLYAEARFKIDDPDNASFWFGLITGSTFFTAPNDYIVFQVTNGGDDLYFTNAVNGNTTNTDTGVDLEDDTWYRVGFHWDGHSTLRWFVFSELPSYEYEGGFCVATGVITTNICQDEELTLGFGIRNDVIE